MRVPPPDPFAEGGHHRTSRTELLHLAASVAVLSVAFAFALSKQALLFGSLELDRVLAILPWATLIVLTAFVLHELAHKVVAERLRMWAEFRASAQGLGLALLVSIGTGVVFAAPGAVMIMGRATERDSGIISIVGPWTNLALGFLAVPLAFGAGEPIDVGAVGNIFEVVVFINLFLAAFNLLPVRPLDGSKIWAWSKAAYLGSVAALVVLTAVWWGSYSPF